MDNKGLEEASKALQRTPCRDPATNANVRPNISKDVYEASNKPGDSHVHIGIHFEGTPGEIPASLLFACFQPAESGGEFLVCDGRQVLRDIDTKTLARLESKQLQPVFEDIPWEVSQPLGPLNLLPFAKTLHREALPMAVDYQVPNGDYFLEEFPPRNGKPARLTVTTHPSSPAIRNPRTGKPVWFTSIDLAHRGLFESRNESGVGKFSTNNFDMIHADGTPISSFDMKNIVKATNKNTKALAMKPGDAVLLDNWSTLHGRKPFSGKRRHAVTFFSD